jgi:hypothetical protein
VRAVRFDLKWRYWAATAVLLTAGVAGWPAGVPAAIAVVLAQLGHFYWRERDAASLTMQVRVLFLAALLLGLWPPLAALHVLAAAGVWANVVFGYCFAARMLSLAPWNRRAPLTAKLVAWTFLSPPTTGSIAARDARPSAAPARVGTRA